MFAKSANLTQSVLNKKFEKITLPFSFSINDSVELLDAKYTIAVRVVFINPETGKEEVFAGYYSSLEEYVVQPGDALNTVSIHLGKVEI